MKEIQRAIYLLSGRINNDLTVQEEKELQGWLAKDPGNQRLFDQLADETYRNSILEQWKPEAAESSLQNIKGKMVHQRIVLFRPWYAAAAASILLFLSIGGYFLLHKRVSQQIVQNQIFNDVAPGENKAILTLSNGKQISLTDAQSGILSKEGSGLVQKASDGTISYEGVGVSNKNQQIVYNKFTTPPGGQWPLIILPDGTKVMLDAASSIKFPVPFADNERKVEITGQAYFEVVHNAAKPFRVLTKGQVIEDIGTAFNINAYDDEANIRTTLLEGVIKVSNPNSSSLLERAGLILKPGQQTVLQNNKLTASNANTEEAIAWKNGYFSLNDQSIKDIMRALSRWYDMEVEYKGTLPDVALRGEIPRNTKLSQALKILEVANANVHFKVEGKKITVTP